MRNEGRMALYISKVHISFTVALLLVCHSRDTCRCVATHTERPLQSFPETVAAILSVRSDPDISELVNQSTNTTTTNDHKSQHINGRNDAGLKDAISLRERSGAGFLGHDQDTRSPRVTSLTAHARILSSSTIVAAAAALDVAPDVSSSANSSIAAASPISKSEVVGTTDAPLSLTSGADTAHTSNASNTSSITTTQHLEGSERHVKQETLVEPHSTDPQDRLAAIILITDFQFKSGDRIASLKLVVRLMGLNLFPHTPTDVYIFTLPQLVSKLKAATKGVFPANVRICGVNPKTWRTPEHVKNESLWHGHWGAPYRQMGDWRLSDMPKLAKDKGHRYVLQTDDDSFIMNPIEFNIVQHFQDNKILIATRYVKKDTALVTWGLPELARYFLVTEMFTPSVLFKNCKPQNLDGLYSSHKSGGGMGAKHSETFETLGLQGTGGWNRIMLNGNFVILDLEMWFTPLVQRFVSLCRSSGGSWRFRWNDQSVQAMVWQLFVPESQLYVFDFEYEHRGVPASIWKKYEKAQKQI